MSVPAWGDQTIGTASRKNLTGIISGTGAYLAGLNKSQFKLLHCTSTGSGFIKDHIYLCLTDGSGVTDVTAIDAHTHKNSSSDGGDFFDVIQANHDLWDYQFNNLIYDNWTEVISGTGNTGNLKTGGSANGAYQIFCDTNTTSGSGANLKYGGIPIDYSRESSFQALIIIEINITSMAFKYGYNMENITSVDDNVRKYGFAGCTSVNGNWFAYSADGDSRSSSDMGVAWTDNLTAILAHKQESGNQIDFWVNEANKLEKTADVPIDGEGNHDGLYRFGVKNNSAVDRRIYLNKLRMTYHTTHAGWGTDQ